MAAIPILGTLTPGATERHMVALPGAALADDRWPVTTITGTRPGPTLFVNAGVHGGEYPAVEAAIRLSRDLNAAELAGTVVVMPVLNLPAFRQRSMFVCPVDNINPNRVFPGKPDGSYSEQLVYALLNEFIVHADAHIDIHGGDIVEALVPFSACRKSDQPADVRALAMAHAFGLPYLITQNRSVQQGTGGTLSYLAAAERGITSLLVEAGGVGQMQLEAVDLLTDGLYRVLAHLGMRATDLPAAPPPEIVKSFDWLYCKNAGMFYPSIAVGDAVHEGQQVGTVGSLFGETLETITSPVDGCVLFLTINPSVQQNGLLMGIGVAA